MDDDAPLTAKEMIEAEDAAGLLKYEITLSRYKEHAGYSTDIAKSLLGSDEAKAAARREREFVIYEINQAVAKHYDEVQQAYPDHEGDESRLAALRSVGDVVADLEMVFMQRMKDLQ